MRRWRSFILLEIVYKYLGHIEHMANPMNVYELPPAHNVCDQVLREVLEINHISLAHVAM